MGFITGWITNIVLFILLAIIIELLLPNSSMQKYVKMVIGLLLIVIILNPLFSILSSDIDELMASIKISPVQDEKNIENLIEMKKKEIQASNHAYILEQTAVQMKTQVEEELVENYDLTVDHVDLTMDDENEEIVSVEVILSDSQANANTEIPVVKPVEIDTTKQLTSETHQRDVKEIISFLATVWEMDAEMIAVTVERRKE